MLGLGKPKEEPVKNTDDKKPVRQAQGGQDDKPAANSSQADEAKAILAKMEAKKESGDCPFC